MGEVIPFVRRIKMPGHVYAARSYCKDWVKIGYSASVEERLNSINIDYRFYAPFQRIGIVPSSLQAEQQIHRVLRPFRVMKVDSCREMYPAVPLILDFVDRFLSVPVWPGLEMLEAVDMRLEARLLSKHPNVRPALTAAYDRLRLKLWGSA